MTESINNYIIYASKCGGCLCNRCKYSVELSACFSRLDSFCNGEEPCFNCDDCMYYDGDFKKKIRFTSQCQKHVESAGSISQRLGAEDRTAYNKRAHFDILKGGIK